MKNIKSSFKPFIVKCDEDGHDYLIPESMDEQFERMLVDAGTLEDPVHSLFMEVFDRYKIGNVFYDLKIYKWEIRDDQS